LAEGHAGESGRQGNELANDWHQPTDKSSGTAVGQEISLRPVYFFRAQKEKLSPGLSDQAINQGPAKIQGQIIIEDGANQTADYSSQDDQPDIKMALAGQIGGRRHYGFRGKRNEGAFDRHQSRHSEIAQVSA